MSVEAFGIARRQDIAERFATDQLFFAISQNVEKRGVDGAELPIGSEAVVAERRILEKVAITRFALPHFPFRHDMLGDIADDADEPARAIVREFSERDLQLDDRSVLSLAGQPYRLPGKALGSRLLKTRHRRKMP